jgi:hypothetical protein
MPYLIKPLKDESDANGGKEHRDYVCTVEERHFIGLINYQNFALVKQYIEKHGKSYFLFAAIVGSLICCVFEIYRRLIAGYEDTKIQENGDV